MVHIDREGWGRRCKERVCVCVCVRRWGGLQRQTRPSLLNQERKVISNSIIFSEGGNSEQMATMATGLAAVSSSQAPFLQDKSAVAS